MTIIPPPPMTFFLQEIRTICEIMAAKMKNLVVSKSNFWGQALRNIMLDYVEVSRDIFKDMKKSPVKSVIYLGLGGAGILLCARSPTLTDYHSEIVEYSNEIGLCAQATRNPVCKAHVDRMSTLLVDGYLLCISFGLFSLILLRPSSSHCCNYHQVCPHVQPRLWTLPDRVVDVGVMGHWLVLRKTMKDFDVNLSEL